LPDYEEKIKALLTDFELFAHITSHDLRDPLRQAIINCEEMKKAAAAPQLLNDTIHSVTEVIDRIALLREYSYLVSFNQELQAIDCNLIMQNAIAELKDKINDNNAQVNYSNMPTIKAYEPHILKVFTCLLDNSIRFKSEKQPEITISCFDNNDHFEFKFSDNGIGIDEVYRHLVFSLFQRLDPEAKDGGFGAGLAFCKKIIENHHGKIWFKSDGENGSDFFFTVPKN
jgi:light-regulated signal transduction histidine kinase (bacteriophytochrome)